MSRLLDASWAVWPLIFIGGLASFFSPCVASLVPGYIGYLSSDAARQEAAGARASERSEVTSRPVWLVSLLFVAGFSVAFVVLGMLAASLGVLLVAFRPVVETVLGIVMIGMGAFLLGWLPESWVAVLLLDRRLHPPPRLTARLGAPAPLLLGSLFAAGWTPCIGSVLAAVLTYVGAQANVGRGVLLLAVYSAGFAVPFVTVGAGWSRGLCTLRWVKRHGHAISYATGIALLLVGLLYVSGEATTFAIWAQRYAPHLPAPALR